eukprot:SAG31_NODE_2_length_46263_cov_45.908043_8_plen_187_part_00
MIELGAGLGVVALAVAALGAAKVIATDGDAIVLPSLESNLHENSSSLGIPSSVLAAHFLSWGDADGAVALLHEADGGGFPPDVIVAADVVFGSDVQVWNQLLCTLDMLTTCCRADAHETGSTLLLLAQTTRYPRERVFFQKLQKIFPDGLGQLPVPPLQRVFAAAGSTLADDGRTTIWALERKWAC